MATRTKTTEEPAVDEGTVEDEAKPTNTNKATKPEGVLVRSTRKNPKLEIVGTSGKRYLFTLESPFVIVQDEDADVVLAYPGIELATPAQAAEFYGKD